MQTTGNSTNIIRQQIYSDGLMESFKDNLLGLILLNDVTSMFPDGDTFNVDQIGQATLSDYSENSEIDYSAIDTSRITLALTDYVQDGFYITDKLKMDSWKSDLLFSKRIKESMFAFGKRLEGDLYNAANASQTAANTNTINGQPHRIALASTYTAQAFVDTLADIKLSFDKANVPEAGRVMIVDSTVENVLNKLATGAVLVADSPRFEGLLESGFAKNHRFVRNIHGFDLLVSNLLPSGITETVDSVAVTDGVANLAMCIADDDTKPMMGVIRQRPTAEFERNVSMKRDEWSATSIWGFASNRPESLIVLLTDNT